MEQDGLFQFSIDNALEIIIIFDDSGTIIYANRSAEQQLEYEKGLDGSLITDIFQGEFRIEAGELFLNWEADGAVRDMTVYRKNHTCFPAKASLLTYDKTRQPWENSQPDKNSRQPGILREHGEQQLYVCTAYNVSNESFLEKKASQAGQEAEDALKVKSEFVANVTHELRTPVNGILGNAQELISQETDKDKLKLLQMIERGCQDMNALINSILDFSKLEAGKFVLEPRKFHFRNMIDYVKGNHSHKITEKGLEFSISVSPGVPEYIIGDELRLVQILNNLISNAYKFTAVGSIHVEVVKTEQSGTRVELFFLVMDTGIGIAKADQDKLFKSFSQVDASISRRYGGTGLGLNICKQLVELMGGSIHVESDTGKGTMFSFHIWVEVPQEECEQDSAGNRESDKEAGKEENKDYTSGTDEQALLHKLQNLSENRVSEKIWKYGEPENLEELEKKMSKLILSVEMENWEKAEMFAETIKQLAEEAPREVKSAALRLKMAVQKGDYDKTTAAFEMLQKML